MNKELEIWKFAFQKLQQEDSIILLVVAESSGSSPGRQGFKMIVAEDDMLGSIGGGVMEMQLVKLARFKIKKSKLKNKPEIIEQVHRKNSPDASGMICSGKQTVIFFELHQAHLKAVRKIVQEFEKQQSQKLRISNSKLQILNAQPDNKDFHFERRGENEFDYEEKLGYKNKLYIVGGGHCALALSELMSRMDFHISLFDDRRDLNTVEKNRFVDEKKIIDSYENIGGFIESGDNVYVVVMTLGFAFDEIVIRELFAKEFKYFGVLGSRAKMKTLLSKLKKENFDEKKLEQIRTPVGIQINSRTPVEIAVSIAAEIISVKNLK